jgi:hypothetical protein
MADELRVIRVLTPLVVLVADDENSIFGDRYTLLAQPLGGQFDPGTCSNSDITRKVQKGATRRDATQRYLVWGISRQWDSAPPNAVVFAEEFDTALQKGAADVLSGMGNV